MTTAWIGTPAKLNIVPVVSVGAGRAFTGELSRATRLWLPRMIGELEAAGVWVVVGATAAGSVVASWRARSSPVPARP